jgi:hypothetical protein
MLYYKETGEPYNLEVGKYIGAEPFDIQYDLPFHI